MRLANARRKAAPSAAYGRLTAADTYLFFSACPSRRPTSDFFFLTPKRSKKRRHDVPKLPTKGLAG
jgi:hypothetical protein